MTPTAEQAGSPTYSYQWFATTRSWDKFLRLPFGWTIDLSIRRDKKIKDATGNTYVVQGAGVAQMITCEVRASNGCLDD